MIETKLEALKRIGIAVLVVTALFQAGSVVLAHEITYKGTVIATATVKGKPTVRISVVNEKTKKPEAKTFEIDANETKILRGDRVVTFEQAQIQKDEKIAVTIDHDLSEVIAYVIRLDARK